MIDTDKVFEAFRAKFDSMSPEERKDYLNEMGFVAEAKQPKVAHRRRHRYRSYTSVAVPAAAKAPAVKVKKKIDVEPPKRKMLLKQVGE